MPIIFLPYLLSHNETGIHRQRNIRCLLYEMGVATHRAASQSDIETLYIPTGAQRLRNVLTNGRSSSGCTVFIIIMGVVKVGKTCSQ